MLVSIVVATFNSGKTLKRCLDSIVPQLGNDCELLVIDGGSKDETLEIIKQYADNIAFTVSEPDRGVYDAWNKAIPEAKGQWITFIGSDDEMLPDAINVYRSFFATNGDNYDLISGKLHYINKEGNVLYDVEEPYNWKKLVKCQLNLAHPGLLHNRSCFERFGLFDIRYHICGDSDFLQRVGKDAKVGFINEFLVNMTEGGLSSSASRVFKEAFLIRKRNHSLNNLQLFLVFSRLYLKSGMLKIKNMINS